MSAVSSKEKNMLLITVVLVLYAGAALSYKKQVANWKAAQRVCATAEKKLQEEKDLIAARDEWSERYEKMRDLMPIFPEGMDVDTHWLSIMDATATKHELAIARRVPGKEVVVGDVYELPIDCKDWEGSLEALVKFLFDLTTQEKAMLDMRQLFIRPSNRPGYLKGTFTLYSAYMRGEEAPQAEGAKAPPEAPAAEAAPTNAPATEAAPTNAPAAEAAPTEAPTEAPAAVTETGGVQAAAPADAAVPVEAPAPNPGPAP
jgi:hypothetical protein